MIIHSETKQKTLEEIAAAFGDKVVLLPETETPAHARTSSVVVDPALKAHADQVEHSETEA